MHAFRVQIVRLADASYPGFVECILRDAMNRDWVLADKVPIFTSADLHEGSTYPQPGIVACEIVREWTDESGRGRCMIDTSRPWGVEAQCGETEFEVFRDQLEAYAP